MAKTPFTEEQVKNLQIWQSNTNTHPFTCCSPNIPECQRAAGINEGILIPSTTGWVCPCGKYTQNWAHDFMTQPSQTKMTKLNRVTKSTNKELVEELTARNLDGKYDQLIKNAMSNRYHDYKNPDDVVCGKMELCSDLHSYPELADIYQKVIDGEYDEVADEEDKASMRAELPKYMWEALGLNPDETEENNSLNEQL